MRNHVGIVLEAGLEPARAYCPQDFKSGVSTNSTTRAFLDAVYLPISIGRSTTQAFMYRTDTFGSIFRGILILFLFQNLLRVAIADLFWKVLSNQKQSSFRTSFKNTQKFLKYTSTISTRFQKAAKLLFALSGR